MEVRTNPYVGPAPFEQADQSLFYGRGGEASELFSLTCAHSVVLFYSQSAAGKTSLLNAGVIPKLKEEKAEVFPVARVGMNLPEGVNEQQIANVFVFNTLLSLQGKKEESFDLRQMSLAQYLKSQDRGGQSKFFYPLRVVIFDQFEELFTSFPEHWKQREAFFVNVSDALKEDPFLRIVFSMREEYIAALEPFAPMLPQRLQKRFRLERLRKEAARSAIEGPIKNTGRSYRKGVADKLVNNLLLEQIKYSTGTRPTMGEFVEPVQLQIVCQRLWETLPANVKEINEKAIAEFGDVDIALARYYDDCLKKVVKAYPDVDEGKLRLWFQASLITPVKTRATVYADVGSTAGLKPRLVKMLENQRLIRPEFRGGATWYELTHDRFIEPILQSNAAWSKSLSDSDAFISELEQQALEWEQAGRPGSLLLADELVNKFRETQRYTTALRQIIPSERLQEYVKASETASEKRQNEEYRKKVAAVAFVTIVAVVVVAYAVVFTIKANQATSQRRTIQIERGRQAKDYAELKGKKLAALIFGIEAVGRSDPADAPPEAVEGLRTALAAVDRRVWLGESDTASASPQRLEMSADGKLALTVNTNELCVWDAITGQKTFPCFPRPGAGEWKKIHFFPDSKWLYALVTPLLLKPGRAETSSKLDPSGNAPTVEPMKQSEVLVFDAHSGERIVGLQDKLRGAKGLEVSGDAQHVLADFDNGVKIVDVADQNVRTPFPARQGLWEQIALSPDGSRLLVVYGTKVDVLATDPDDKLDGFVMPISNSTDSRDIITFSRDSRYGVLVRPSSTSGETAGLVWDNITGKGVATFKTKVEQVQYAAFSTDNDQLVVSGKTEAEVFEVKTGNMTASYPFPDGNLVIHAGLNTVMIQASKGTCTVFVWDALRGTSQVSQETYATRDWINMAAATPDASRIVVADEDKVIQIWTLAQPLPVGQLSAQELLAAGCEKLRNHKEELDQVSQICQQWPPTSLPGR